MTASACVKEDNRLEQLTLFLALVLFGDYPARKTVVLDPIEPVKYERATLFSTGPVKRFSHHTGYRRPHVRHWYHPCVGHIGSSCINLHQKSAIRAIASIQSFHPSVNHQRE